MMTNQFKILDNELIEDRLAFAVPIVYYDDAIRLRTDITDYISEETVFNGPFFDGTSINIISRRNNTVSRYDVFESREYDYKMIEIGMNANKKLNTSYEKEIAIHIEHFLSDNRKQNLYNLFMTVNEIISSMSNENALIEYGILAVNDRCLVYSINELLNGKVLVLVGDYEKLVYLENTKKTSFLRDKMFGTVPNPLNEFPYQLKVTYKVEKEDKKYLDEAVRVLKF